MLQRGREQLERKLCPTHMYLLMLTRKQESLRSRLFTLDSLVLNSLILNLSMFTVSFFFHLFLMFSIISKLSDVLGNQLFD